MFNCVIVAVAQIVERQPSHQRLLISGSIPKPAMHPCVLGKGTLRLFPIRAKQPSSSGCPPDKRIAN